MGRLNDIQVTGVSFGDESMEIIFINNEEQSEFYGQMHTIYVSTKADPDLVDDYRTLQKAFIDIIEFFYSQQVTRRSAFDDLDADEFGKQIAEAIDEAEDLEFDGE